MLFPSLALIDDRQPRSAALNMALDEALLRLAGGPTLRAYRWATEAVSFGYFEKYAAVCARYPGRELVRRWTGGGVVDHAGDFTYSLVLPGPRVLSGPELYCAVHRALAHALGGDAELATETSAAVSNACFENPVTGDVLVRGRKVAGAAQRRTREGTLLQGSVAAPGSGLLEKMGRKLARRTVAGTLSPEVEALGARLAGSRYATEEWLTLR